MGNGRLDFAVSEMGFSHEIYCFVLSSDIHHRFVLHCSTSQSEFIWRIECFHHGFRSESIEKCQ